MVVLQAGSGCYMNWSGCYGGQLWLLYRLVVVAILTWKVVIEVRGWLLYTLVVVAICYEVVAIYTGVGLGCLL